MSISLQLNVFSRLPCLRIGYRIARVRALFSLPPDIQRLRPESTRPDSHLAYLELFTAFTDESEQPSSLYAVSKSYHGGARKTIILPVRQIFRSCHLLPRYGTAVDRTWESATVLDQCHSFFLNAFSDHHMYLFVE